jgi:phosphoribosylformylglycinamidine (FGAM) synthase-like enzyme
LEGCPAGVALSVDCNPAYGDISAYWGAACAVAEAMRNVASVGAVPQAMTDCLNYGNPENPVAFAQFRDGVRGLSDAAKNLWLKGYEGQPLPIVSGNVSLYNESATGNAVSPTAVIACVGTMPDASKAVTMQLKQAGDGLFLVGPRKDELGGSALYQALGLGLGANVPKVDWEPERAMIYAVTDAIDAGFVAACTDISDGGMAVAICEMCLGGFALGQLGASVDLSALGSDLRADKVLFSESSGFVMEAVAGRDTELQALFAKYGLELVRIGEVTDAAEVSFATPAGKVCCPLSELKEAWLGGLPKVLR